MQGKGPCPARLRVVLSDSSGSDRVRRKRKKSPESPMLQTVWRSVAVPSSAPKVLEPSKNKKGVGLDPSRPAMRQRKIPAFRKLITGMQAGSDDAIASPCLTQNRPCREKRRPTRGYVIIRDGTSSPDYSSSCLICLAGMVQVSEIAYDFGV